MTTAPEHGPLPDITRDVEQYPYTVDLDQLEVYEENPVTITREVREKLDAFEEHDPDANWGWFVQTNSILTEYDFKILTRQRKD